VLPTLRFSREFGLVFCGVAGFFEGLRVASLSAYFNRYLLVFWAVFLQIYVLRIFFSIFVALLLFQCTAY